VRDAYIMDYVNDQYWHGNAILALGAAQRRLASAGIAAFRLKDCGVFRIEADKQGEVLADFKTAIAVHRHLSPAIDHPEI